MRWWELPGDCCDVQCHIQAQIAVGVYGHRYQVGLGTVEVGPLLLHEVDVLLQQWVHSPDDADIITLWTHALVYVWIICSDVF